MSVHCDIVILRNKERIRYLKKKKKEKRIAVLRRILFCTMNKKNWEEIRVNYYRLNFTSEFYDTTSEDFIELNFVEL